MSERTAELRRLYEHFGGDTGRLLSEYPELSNLCVFSDRREGLLEWFSFRAHASLLSVGSGLGALLPLYLRRGLSVTLLDSDREALEFSLLRAQNKGGESREQPAVRTLCGTISELPDTERYDYIIFDGTLHREDSAAVERAKQLLTPEGVLIVAVDNAYGVRAFTGAETEENAMGRESLCRLLSAGERGAVSCYYPEPLRTLPNELYSERRLPGEGELSRVIPAYGFPLYTAINPGEKYDAICREGLFPQFADAYLCFWQREDAAGARFADTAIYVKYNRNRRAEYQLKTVIREDGGRRWVEKVALSEAGRQHIQDFRRRRELLLSEGSGIRYAEAELSEDGMCARFPWVEGESLTALLLREIRGGRAVTEVLSEALQRVLGAGEVHNLDSIFDNFLVQERAEGIAEAELSGIDYEWVSETPVERGFVRYRALRAFYESQRESLKLPEKEAFFRSFGTDAAELKRFEEQEAAFQRRIAGEEQAVYLDRFVSELRSRETIEKTERDLRIANERLSGFRAELKEKDAAIRKMTEVKRLTDNHVTNLEIMISDLRREAQAAGELMSYLGRHQTLLSRIRRRLGDSFNARYPRGSRERKRLAYRKQALLHPIRHYRLTSTEEGRNLIEGDFAIGDIYREHGRLHFPHQDAPLVSIVIPCYNQIEYTYACLLSILQHTQGIPYEIIIADDVSTDETRHLERFAGGLIISRNSVNQGFLRNCNQAAAKARGEYIFFLNNDTKVTEGWLDWLLKLIQSDARIGMVGSKLVYPDGRLQEAGGIIWSDASGWNYGRLQDPDAPEYNYVKDVDYMSGAAILIRRPLWEEIGGFDERYAPAYCEDSDLAFEVRRHGYRVVYQPKSVVIHFEGVSNGTDVQGTGLKRYQIENTEKLKEKWKEELQQQFENIGSPDPFRARERSRGKKIVLVVDHYVPTFDRDAGSRTTWQYLQMLVKQGFQVKFLGDNFAHEEPYTTALQQLGIEVLYGQEMQVGIWEWIERHERDIHLVYLNRPHIASKYIDFIQSRTGLKVLYYGHDLHFLRERREYELTGDPEKRESSDYWKSVELSLMHKADMSFYPSEVECEAIRRIDPGIRVKALTAYLWDSFPEDIETDYERREGLLFVGGFAHPPNADAVLWFLDEVWPKLQGGKKLNFYIVGSKAPEEISARHDPEHGVHVLGFVSDEELRSLYNRCRLVVVPLRYGAGVKGKVIEALYYGAAVVTSSVGAEGIPGAEEVMRIADHADVLAEAIRSLYPDSAALRALSLRAQLYVREHNSMEAAWKVVAEDFLS